MTISLIVYTDVELLTSKTKYGNNKAYFGQQHCELLLVTIISLYNKPVDSVYSPLFIQFVHDIV